MIGCTASLSITWRERERGGFSPGALAGGAANQCRMHPRLRLDLPIRVDQVADRPHCLALSRAVRAPQHHDQVGQGPQGDNVPLVRVVLEGEAAEAACCVLHDTEEREREGVGQSQR